ncbi:receptor-type tyrosine-protein phosphatase eta isoform X4 [Suricata suricatta]|uniref:receptor-type tyrosine-protein phosphatase eta isoform X4 n=1 Tax=Suricata suricatta TaxID=37032 RepID=UPI0011566E2C|nr:receptor-type tyrosine-protein phosphatase eta isoform X4 [Suricata suricatta]
MDQRMEAQISVCNLAGCQKPQYEKGNFSLDSEEQMVCAGDSVSVGPTSMTPAWTSRDLAATEYPHTESDGQASDNTTGSSSTASYTSFVTSETVTKSWRDSTVANNVTEPSQVSDLRVSFVGVTQVTLTWKNGNDTVTCRMLLEAIESHNTLPQVSAVSISHLTPGIQHKITLCLSESNEEDRERGVEANTTESFSQQPRNRMAPVSGCQLKHAILSSDRLLTRDTEVLIMGLGPDTQYNASVYSQAADGTEGQPQLITFRTLASQVLDLRVVSINATSMNLTWKINDNESPSVYTYKIQVTGETDSFTLNVSETQVIITSLNSSTLYNITVHPFFGNSSEGVPGFLQVYTPPHPVSDFRVTSVRTREIGLAWSSNDADFFKILTTEDGAGKPLLEAATPNQSIVIGGLYPGTKYRFEIFPQGPNGTEGESQMVYGRTDPSAVFDIQVLNVTTTGMELEWENTDNGSEYTYHLVIQSERGSEQKTSSDKKIILEDLVPGTLYNITIFPEVNHIQGTPGSIAQYTWPSDVANIDVNTSTTTAALIWQNFDEASPRYTYHLFIEKDGNISKVLVTDIGVTSATVTELIPGSSYTVEIFTQVGDVTTPMASGRQSFCTDPAPVASFRCEVVPKEPTLILKWACPPGTNTGFGLEISRGAWKNVTELDSCSSENGTEYRTNVTYLNFSTSYNISITALSCNKTASPIQNTCLTGITDPPSPDGSPNITSISHNSVKVEFSGFEASHGPIKAYALILTTGDAIRPSADVLRYTYEDFKKGASNTYVTYLITTEEKRRSQDSSEVLKYEIDVGNESTTHGYYNGKLEPLGSYRACVAGFTNITFKPHSNGLIDGPESYVSFSHYSDAVSLPQDPGVICGAVFGCIFGALVIVAVGGFIFWRKKRKEAKNNELSFSQIKPKKSKLIRVENFEAYFKKQQADSNCGFAEEYEDLKLVGISLPKYTAELAENRGKNRYNNVLPYDISRVKLSVQSHSTDDYINANYMPGYHSKKDFIATQGPLPNTLKDFWRMVWEKNVYAIVMLTKCVEQGRTKCEEYWPSKQAQDYGDITVAMTSEIVLPQWTIRDFTVKNLQTSESHPLRQFHFTSWPDHGVPDTTDLLINFRYLVRDYMKQSPPGSPILVHCSAGVGRTGTFIAIDRLIYQIENENTVDVYGIVYDLRMHRPLMVQTEDQYVFLNQCVLDIIRSQKDSKVDLIYQNTTAMTIYENLAPVTAFGRTNGYIA